MSFEQWQQIITRIILEEAKRREPEIARQLFNLLVDENPTGQVGVRQLFRWTEHENRKYGNANHVDDGEVIEMVEEVDGDADGLIDFEEFEHVLGVLNSGKLRESTLYMQDGSDCNKATFFLCSLLSLQGNRRRR